MQVLSQFFVNTFNNPSIATFIVAMLPIFELRGAIPFGVSSTLWGTKALSVGKAFLISFIASSLIVPIIALLFKPLLNYLKNTRLFKKLAFKIEERIVKKTKKFEDKNTRLKKFFGIFLFVAVPLPLTGVYTGTMLSVMLNLSFLDTIFSVMLGNLCAGSIITLISLTSPHVANLILVAFVCLIAVIILYSICKFVFNKIRNKKAI